MAKRILVMLLCLVLLCSCAKNNEEPEKLPNTDDTIESVADPVDTDIPPIESTPDETIPKETLPPETLPDETPTPPETTDVVHDIGGSHM